MLAVVGGRWRVAVPLRKRLDSAAECRPRLVQHHLVSRIDELDGGGKSGESAADHGDLLHTLWMHRCALVTTPVSETGAQPMEESQARLDQ